MWKLTIIQKRKSEYSDFKDTHKTEFVSETSVELLAITSALMDCHTIDETKYSIEKVQEGEGNEVGI